MSNWKLPKWAVVVAAAFLFLPLVVDWVAPGDGARIAEHALREVKVGGEGEQWMLFPFWSWLVGLAGKDVAAIGAVSAGAGLVCVWLVAAIVGAIFGAAVRGAKAGGIKGEEGNYAGVESAAVLLAGLGFALTPGFLVAATRVSPLLAALVPGLAAAAIVVSVCWGQHGEDAASTLVGRMKKGKGRLLLAVGLVGYSAFELVLARRVFLSLAFPVLGVWLGVGMMPALVIAWCVWKRWIARRKAIWGALGGWALAVVVMAVVAFTSGELNEGRSANRLVAQIIANAEESGKIAVVSDGVLDDLFFFMLPERVKLISLAREREPEYGRELSDWIIKHRDTEAQRADQPIDPKLGAQPPDPASLCLCASVFKTNIVEDLAFAAELGPKALIDEWAKLDKQGFEAVVASAVNFFPTREKWDEACVELDGMRTDEPMAKYLRHLLGVCGNALGCRMLEEVKSKSEKGKSAEREAWAIFKKIVDTVEPTNYGAYLNLLGMVQRGYAVSKDEVADLTKRRQQIEKNLKSWEYILRAARSGGRLYADPDDVAKYEKAKEEMAVKRELSPGQKAFIKTVTAAPKDPKSGKAAQEAIHKAIREGRVRADRIGGHLITIDLAIGDGESAEKDAIDVLKLDRHHPTANATIGAIAGARGDHERAERYLKRAIATGKASISAKNDLAYSLMKLGRLDEAEPFAREAVKGFGEVWTLRETLAAILIRKGQIEEGERELAKAEELAAKAGIPKGKLVSIEIDRARILKAKEDYEHLKIAMRALRVRKDLTDEQRAEVKGMDW